MEKIVDRRSANTETMDQPQKLGRPTVAKLNRILGAAFKVLDDGFVRIVDYMGDEAAIVQAARVSYGAGTKKAQSDVDLIRYLMRHRHSTPFEMCELKLHVRAPMDCWRQWIRHRTASVNEYSTRYSLAIDAAQRTSPDQWRAQAITNRQGSAGHLAKTLGAKLSKRERELQAEARHVYLERIEFGVAREQARKDLPLSTYTEAYWKIDLHNLLHFLELRMHPAAQVEIRQYAQVIGTEIVSRWLPNVWVSFLNYRIEAQSFSGPEMALLALILKRDFVGARQRALRSGIVRRESDGRIKPTRELGEFEQKLGNLGIEFSWNGEG